ncbi:hypothetical protein [Pseudobythopirellula maris]|nr:hypothetical protein [Pseudobythopirellula maris]
MKFLQINPAGGLGSVGLSFNGDLVAGTIGQQIWDVRNETGTPELQLIDIADGDGQADNLISFCIELSQYVKGSWQDYDKGLLAAAPDPFLAGAPGYVIGADRAAALDLLADNYWAAATGSNLVDAIAFQLAIWEIVHEDPSGPTDNPPLAATLDVSDNQGTFFVTNDSPSGDLATAIGVANSWLGSLPSLTGNDSLSLMALMHPTQQDQIVQLQANPEPATMMVWGVLVAGVLVRTNRQKRSLQG